MALASRRSKGISGTVWPGFVDAMTALLLVLMFVLSIFMIVQFMLRETISGQATELDELTAQVSDLASALGLEQARSAGLQKEVVDLNSTISDATDRAEQQNALIASLTRQTEQQGAALRAAETKITDFESQVATLIGQRDEARQAGADLTAERDSLLSDKEALDLALASVRKEVSAQEEAARLAAAKADAMTALIADLQQKDKDSQASLADLAAELSESDKARAALADRAEGLEASLKETDAARLARSEEVSALQQRVADAEAKVAALTSDLSEADKARLTEAAAAEQLRQRLADSQGALTEAEKARLAEAAAAEALRAKLASSDAELTAMTLRLEEERKQAEDTLTLLAAARKQQDDLTAKLAAQLAQMALRDKAADEAKQAVSTVTAMLSQAEDELVAAEKDRAALRAQLTQAETARDQARSDLDAARSGRDADAQALGERLSAAETERDAAAAQLAEAVAARDAVDAEKADAEDKLAEALAAQAALQADRSGVADRLVAAEAELAALKAEVGDEAELQKRLAAAIAARAAAEDAASTQLSEAERQSALLAEARDQLSGAKAQSVEDQNRIEVLNQQMAALRQQIGDLQSVIGEANDKDQAQEVRIENLGTELNTALARAALAEKKLAAAAEAEKARLEAENKALAGTNKDLEQYKSEFFGRLRALLGDREGVQVVGDRFVFSSEVLFDVGSASLSEAGKGQIAQVKAILDEVSGEIPPSIDWIIRVDGHTDSQPITGGPFANWRLSQARALSVVEFMVTDLGFPPERLAATGFGEWQPVDPGDTPDAWAKNRRIELKLTER